MKTMLRSILLIVFCLSFNFSYAQNGEQLPSLEDWMKEYKFFGQSVRGFNSMNDGLHYSSLVDRGTSIVRSAYSSGEIVDTIINLKQLPKVPFDVIEDYTFSSNEKKLLIATQIEPIYRRSFTAVYYLFDFEKASLKLLSDGGPQQLATFNPTGDKIAFARANNLFIVDLKTNIETQITFDGEKNKIINGIPDWVYEEEFEFNQAFDWSPDGKNIAFIRFDESKVPEFGMTMFEGLNPSLTENKLYPEHRVWKYPKAGDENSIVSVHVFNLSNKQTKKMKIGDQSDIYIPRIKWTQQDNQLCIYLLNRLQNKLELMYADTETGKTNIFLTEENERYIDEKYFDDLSFLSDHKHFIYLSEKDGFSHLYLYTIQGKEIRALSSGAFDVTQFIGYDETNQLVFYQAAAVSPSQREIYSVNLKGKKTKKISTKVGWNSAQFSKTFDYYVITHSSASVPSTYVLYNSKGDEIRVLEDNARLKKTLENFNFNQKEFFVFTTEEGIKLYGSMIKPAYFDESKKYPVLLTQYSGPNSQQVTDRWSFGWEQILAAKGFVIITVDGRGTGARGEDFRKCTYLQLGKYETIDQIETAKYIKSFNFVDPNRIGIWGWSYGGFVSTLALMKGDGIFKAGIAVAPVTNWRYYDNIYTERFMRTPQENPEGYDQNSPLFFADQMKGNYLLIHGTADDNVHWQNAAELAERLVQADKDFEMFYYTNRNHGIFGGNTRYHLYKKKTKFLMENL